MQFPIIKKEDKSMALEVPDDLLQQLTSKPSQQAEAELKESQGKVTEMEARLGKVAELEESLATANSRTMDDYSQTEKANFVIAWARELSPADQAIFCEGVGIPIVKVAEVSEADKAAAAEAEQKAKDEAEQATAAEVGEGPATIVGKTDKPGYKYLPHLNMSVKE